MKKCNLIFLHCDAGDISVPNSQKGKKKDKPTSREELLKKATEKYPSIQVEKHLELHVDVGNLCGLDLNPVELKEYK